MAKKKATQAPDHPECCNRPMNIHQRRGRRSGKVIVFLCPECGTSRTVPA
jgi:hypothetical protein